MHWTRSVFKVLFLVYWCTVTSRFSCSTCFCLSNTSALQLHFCLLLIVLSLIFQLLNHLYVNITTHNISIPPAHPAACVGWADVCQIVLVVIKIDTKYPARLLNPCARWLASARSHECSQSLCRASSQRWVELVCQQLQQRLYLDSTSLTDN